MKYRDFVGLCLNASEANDFEQYCVECGGALPECKDPVAALRVIYDMEHRDFAGMRKAAGMTQAQLSERYGVSKRTVESWSAGDANARNPREWVTRMVAFAIVCDML